MIVFFGIVIFLPDRSSQENQLLSTDQDYQEIVTKRSFNGKHFSHGNGIYTAVFSQSPIHYSDNNGELQEINLEFEKKGETYISDKNNVHIKVGQTSMETINPHTGKGIEWIIPSHFTVTKNEAYYEENGITWKYTPRPEGTKLSALVEKMQGAQTYSFEYRLVGSTQALTKNNENGTLQGDGFVIPEAFVIGNDGKRYDVSPWEVSSTHISFSFDDSSLPPQAYPYEIDPTTTFDIAADADDGDWNSVTGVDTADPRIFFGLEFGVVVNSYLRFQNITLRGADTITNATIDVVALSDGGGTWPNNLIRGIKEINPEIPSSYADANGRPRTSNSVAWSQPSNWNAGSRYSSNNIASILNEIIKQPGWQIGDTLMLYIEFQGTPAFQWRERAFAGREHATYDAPRLTITYTAGPTPTPTPTPEPLRFEGLKFEGVKID